MIELTVDADVVANLFVRVVEVIGVVVVGENPDTGLLERIASDERIFRPKYASTAANTLSSKIISLFSIFRQINFLVFAWTTFGLIVILSLPTLLSFKSDCCVSPSPMYQSPTPNVGGLKSNDSILINGGGHDTFRSVSSGVVDLRNDEAPSLNFLNTNGVLPLHEVSSANESTKAVFVKDAESETTGTIPDQVLLPPIPSGYPAQASVGSSIASQATSLTLAAPSEADPSASESNVSAGMVAAPIKKGRFTLLGQQVPPITSTTPSTDGLEAMVAATGSGSMSGVNGDIVLGGIGATVASSAADDSNDEAPMPTTAATGSINNDVASIQTQPPANPTSAGNSISSIATAPLIMKKGRFVVTNIVDPSRAAAVLASVSPTINVIPPSAPQTTTLSSTTSHTSGVSSLTPITAVQSVLPPQPSMTTAVQANQENVSFLSNNLAHTSSSSSNNGAMPMPSGAFVQPSHSGQTALPTAVSVQLAALAPNPPSSATEALATTDACQGDMINLHPVSSGPSIAHGIYAASGPQHLAANVSIGQSGNSFASTSATSEREAIAVANTEIGVSQEIYLAQKILPHATPAPAASTIPAIEANMATHSSINITNILDTRQAEISTTRSTPMEVTSPATNTTSAPSTIGSSSSTFLPTNMQDRMAAFVPPDQRTLSSPQAGGDIKSVDFVGMGKVCFFLDQMRLEVLEADKAIMSLRSSANFLVRSADFDVVFDGSTVTLIFHLFADENRMKKIKN
jgi:hypothetical protein